MAAAGRQVSGRPPRCRLHRQGHPTDGRPMEPDPFAESSVGRHQLRPFVQSERQVETIIERLPELRRQRDRGLQMVLGRHEASRRTAQRPDLACDVSAAMSPTRARRRSALPHSISSRVGASLGGRCAPLRSPISPRRSHRPRCAGSTLVPHLPDDVGAVTGHRPGLCAKPLGSRDPIRHSPPPDRGLRSAPATP